MPGHRVVITPGQLRGGTVTRREIERLQDLHDLLISLHQQTLAAGTNRSITGETSGHQRGEHRPSPGRQMAAYAEFGLAAVSTRTVARTDDRHVLAHQPRQVDLVRPTRPPAPARRRRSDSGRRTRHSPRTRHGTIASRGCSLDLTPMFPQQEHPPRSGGTRGLIHHDATRQHRWRDCASNGVTECFVRGYQMSASGRRT
jgi:hypothetical protein